MLVQYYYPNILKPKQLDNYLSKGWFRNANMMYRTKLICLNSELHSVVNIRLKTEKFEPSKRLRKIIRKNDSRFSVIYRPAILDEEKNELYQTHKSRFEGFIYSSLELFFYGEEKAEAIFNTFECCVYDGEELVAVSFFDIGENSIASLLALYKQSHQKYSLGTYTMLKEIEFAQQRGIRFYYPGYVLDRVSVFDYKLKIGAYQFYNSETNRWRKWQLRKKMKFDSDFLKEKIAALEKVLSEYEIEYNKFIYPLFSIGYIDYSYLRSPIFIACFKNEIPTLVIEYWLEEEQYVLSNVRTLTFENNPDIVEFSENYSAENNFLSLISYNYNIQLTENPYELIDFILEWQEEDFEF